MIYEIFGILTSIASHDNKSCIISKFSCSIAEQIEVVLKTFSNFIKMLNIEMILILTLKHYLKIKWNDIFKLNIKWN